MLSDIPEGAVWAIMLLPIGSLSIISLVSLLGLTRDGVWNPRFSGYVTILAIGTAFLLSLWALDTAIAADGHRTGFDAHEWVFVDPLRIDIGITLDGLSGIMLVIVTGVSLLVQIYSQEYMRGDEGYNRYFAFMSLFTASMLGLVIASSILQIFVFWELVGVSSYLLIGFWFFKDAARRAATKAFVVTRIGDLGFLIAILIIWSETGELNVPVIHELAAAGAIGSTTLTWFALGIFAGAAGKSAQFPLHVWLPDAMEGPTPVSALIHAATMVVAGVYLVARFFPVFAASDDAIVTVAAIGSITAIIAALLGIVATDIKRVLAYSTISQLGYMMMGLGVGGLVAVMFHLFTHAFFKALLFLGAGSVNHATGTFDMRKMGGLRTAMPITFATMTIGSLALVGIFPLAGFWSKDEILADAWQDRQWVFWVALTGVFLTALYVGRMLIITFSGEYRGGEKSEHENGPDTSKPHESPILMTAPLVVLAVLAATAGFVNIDHGMTTLIEGWLPEATEELVTQSSFELWIAAASTAAGAAGLTVAWAVYYAKIFDSEKIGSFLEPLPEILGYKYYMDILYEDILVKRGLIGGIAYGVSLWDEYVIDNAVNGAARLTGLTSEGLRHVQTGQVQAYGAAMFVGLLGAVAAILIINPS